MKKGTTIGLISGIAIYIIIRILLPDIVCVDGWGSPSIGRQGACSHHGGVDNSPLVYTLFFSLFVGFIIASYFNGKEDQRLEKEREEKLEELKRNSPSCPKCGSYMVKKLARKGKYSGREFWGCSRYPACKGIINIENSNKTN